jgi:hypothetical protein
MRGERIIDDGSLQVVKERRGADRLMITRASSRQATSI